MVACGDTVSGTGEFGKVNYSLYTVYLSETSAIQDGKLLVGHPQTIMTELTLSGSREVDDPTKLTHTVSPAEDTTLYVSDDGFDVPDARLTVNEPGSYSLETQVSGELFDRIQLEFAKPDRLDVVTWVKLTRTCTLNIS